MIVTFGSFSFSDNEAMVTDWRGSTIYDARGYARFRRKRMVIEGEVIASGAAAIDARVAQIQAAFELGGFDAGLYIPPSTLTHIDLPNSTSLTGVRVVQPPNFPMRDGQAHYATGQPFHIVLEAEYLLNPGDDLVDYEETISYSGDGGPRKVVLELVEGQPVIQYTTQYTPITVTQSGRAVGILGYPDVNPPLADALLDRPDGIQVTRRTPTKVNGIGIQWVVEWTYTITADEPSLVAAGLPTFPTPYLR